MAGLLNDVKGKRDHWVRFFKRGRFDKAYKGAGINRRESSGASLKISVISAEKNAVSKPGISFSAKGTFEQLFKYLYFLENLPYLITINKVSFQREEAGEENTQADSKKTTWFQVGGRYSAYNWKVMKIDFKK